MSTDQKGSVAERVKKIIVNNLGADPEKVVDHADFVNDLEADSLDTVELIMSLEEEFDIEIPDDEAEKIRNVKGAISYVESCLEKSVKD